jgi:hypothetical protein
MQTETNEPAPRKLYYVEGHFDKRTYYTAWIEADSKVEAEDIAEMLDEEDAVFYHREVKGYVQTDQECYAGDNYRVILVDPAQDHLVMPDEVRVNFEH